jgi:hypothetical protein
MFITGRFTLRFCSVFLLLAVFSSLVVEGTLVHAIDLASLVESSDLIVSGSVTSVTEQGRGTINTACGTLTGKKLLLVLLPDETIKGAAETASLPVELGIPEAPCAIRGVPSQQYGIFFLQREGPGYRFSDPMYPFLPAVRGGGSTTGPPLDRIVAKLGETLTYGRSTEVEISSALDALATIQRDSATQTLRQALERTNGEVQLRIAWHLLAHNDMTGLDLVERALSHPAALSDYWLLNLAGSLGGLKDPRAVPALKRLLETNNQRIIKGAAIALRQSGSADALEPLSRLLTNNDEQVRYYAVVGMGEITRQDEWAPTFPEFREHEAKYVSYWRDWAASNLPRGDAPK